MAKQLKAHVTFHNPGDGNSHTFGPGDDLPDWVDTSSLDESLLEGGEDAAEAHDAEEVSGPGQVGPPETEEEAAEKRREADRNRKAAKRAADKKAAEDAAALEAAQAAEAQRAQEQGGGN